MGKKQKNKKKNSLLTYFALLMIVGGILVLLYPIAGNYLANRERSEAVSHYSKAMKKMTEAERAEQLTLAKQYNEYIFKRQQGEEAAKVDYTTILRKNEVMGTIDIPAINIEKMPFFQGTDYLTLDRGLGHFELSSIPIGGKNTRSVITGHSGVQNQILFSDVLHLVEGDIFFVNVLGKRLAYRVSELEEILPSEVDKVNIKEGKDQVTLLTCTPPGINTFRLLVTGDRIPYKEAQQQKVIPRNRFSYQNIVLTALGINLLIFLILIGIYQYYVRQLHSEDKEISSKASQHLKQLFFVTKTFFVLLFIAMLCVLGMALYGYFQMQEEQPMETVNIGQSEELNQYNLDKISRANFEDRQIVSARVSEYAKAKTELKKTVNDWGIGKLVIPDVDIDLPILAGVLNQNLLLGAATYRPEQQLGKDNYVLLAHNIIGQGVLLNRISELKEGALVYATDFKEVFIYEVYLNKIVEDTEVEYINNTAEQEAIITLFRCDGGIGTIYRQLVQGKLKERLPLNEASPTMLKQLDVTRNDVEVTGELINKDPISPFDKFCMIIAARVVSDPMQTIVPLFLLFIVPIVFFSLI